jgi:transcriptional regulator with XRE-family HTH domain
MADDHSTGSVCPATPIPDELGARQRLAENLKVLRLLHRWSQEALAEAAQLHRTYVGGIERAERNVSLDNLERLAGAFGLTIPELLQGLDGHAVGERLLANIRRTLAPRGGRHG